MWLDWCILASKDTVRAATRSCDVVRQVCSTPLGKSDQERHLSCAESQLPLLGIKKFKKIVLKKKKDADCQSSDLINSFQQQKKKVIISVIFLVPY